ncbi:MAG: ABC transporter permease [Armatimonadota bacterium]
MSPGDGQSVASFIALAVAAVAAIQGIIWVGTRAMARSRLERCYDLTLGTTSLTCWLWAFFILFLAFPLAYVFVNAFRVDGRVSLTFFRLMLRDPVQRLCIVNSVNIATITTLATTLISLPLGFLMVRRRFPGKGIFSAAILVPMVMPPFVGAIGMKQLFARFGSVNLLLMNAGLIHHPIDWFGGGFAGVVILETLHLYPIMFLNIAAALANVDPSLEEAAQNLGASGWRLFRTVTFPLMLPGYFAGAVIVWIWAFTDLGTPLMFEYRGVVAVQIFDKVSDLRANPVGYALVVLVVVVTMAFFYLSTRYLGGQRYEMMGRGGHIAEREQPLSAPATAATWGFMGGIIGLALLPHLSVILTSVGQKWFMSVLPQEASFVYYHKVLTHELTLPSIRNSLMYSSLSTVVDVALGIAIAYLLTRRRIPGRDLLDATAMIPLALPGLVLAFGYVACFADTPIDPRGNPTALLVIAYAVRRLPY